MRMFFLMHSCLAAAVLILASGCESKFEKYYRENGPAVEAKLETIESLAGLVKAEPTVPPDYDAWVRAVEGIGRIQSIADSKELDPAVKEQATANVDSLRKESEAMFDKIKLSPPSEIRFQGVDNPNAAVLILNANGTAERDADFVKRNEGSGSWYLNSTSIQDLESAQKQFEFVKSLRFVLILRQVDIVEPEFIGNDDQEHAEYQMGAIECEAFLFSIDDRQLIGRFRFAATNERSALSVGPFELFMPDEPDAAVSVFRSRLFDSARRYAAAIAAELSPQIQAQNRIVRDFLGTRLKPIESN
ncbi:hypothetical protein [Stieleria varia]|uniref:Lipoprotein n=1 Tax=Stieleria varia TaxID=2528005 RepID=A0A5C6B6B3_9BACT|nr:hypothetical protein [Stieleria varia]TWU06054.1 hypothetical protein Pla52n_17730 [Stieleria varia]